MKTEISIKLKDTPGLREEIAKLLLENMLLKKEKNDVIDQIDTRVDRKIESRRRRKIMGAIGIP